jgi:hypothetical protein
MPYTTGIARAGNIKAINSVYIFVLPQSSQ